jgi:hypothetical protein
MKILTSLAYTFILAVVLLTGLFFRLREKPQPTQAIAQINIVAYYYDESRRFFETGKFPSQDRWRFAPGSAVENAPVGLTLVTAGYLKAVKFILPKIDIGEATFNLPPLIFLIWAGVGFLTILRLTKSKTSALLFLTGLSLIPASIGLTRFAHYSEEFLGSFLVFITIIYYLFWLKEKKELDYYISFLSLVFLELTWQQFPLILFIVFLGAVFSFKKDVFLKTLLLILGSLIVSQIFCFVVGSGYSPVVMLKEAYIGIRGLNSSIIRTAMGRKDWSPLTTATFLQYFGYYSGVFGILGLIVMILNWKELYVRTAIIGFLITSILAIRVSKDMAMALPFLILAIGFCGLRLNKKQYRFLYRWAINKITIVIVAILIAIYLFIKGNNFINNHNPPIPNFTLRAAPLSANKSGPYRVFVTLTNFGGNGLLTPDAFSGLHIEVKNASVSAIRAFSPATKSGVVIKPNAKFSPSIYWFETKFDQLKSSNFGQASFTIYPYFKNINTEIYVRGWSPGSCGLVDRVKTMLSLRPEWSNWANSWRSESCIKRIPNQTDFLPGKTICLVDVYAAHKEKQQFFCRKITVRPNNLQLSNKTIWQRVALAYDWIKRDVNKTTGRLNYLYYPETDTFSTSNNTTRQLGASWTTLKTEDFLGKKDLNAMVKKTLDYYLARKFLVNDKTSAYLNSDGQSSISYNAFVILILMRFDYPNKWELISQFAKGILLLQRSDGAYLVDYKDRVVETGKIGITSGEAMLSLMQLYQNTKDPRYLESVKKAFVFYRDYWRKYHYFFIHWQTQALVLLYNETHDPQIANFIFEMNDYTLNKNQITQSAYKDEIGGIPKTEPGNNTAVIMEGVGDAYVLATKLNDQEHVKKYGEAIRLATPFILSLQVTDTQQFKNPKRAYGGFVFSFKNNSMIIDNTFHSLNSLMKIYNLGLF